MRFDFKNPPMCGTCEILPGMRHRHRGDTEEKKEKHMEKRKRPSARVAGIALVSYFALGALLFLPPAPAAPAKNSADETETGVASVYVDAGHGGFDTGAIGYLSDGSELPEKELDLWMALAVGERLSEKGCRVTYARADDVRLTYTNSRDEILARRAAAKEAGASLLLSLHANAYAGEGRAFGARVYYNPKNKQAAAIGARLAAAITEETGELVGRACRAVPDGSYLVLADESQPAVLVEVGFLSDPQELRLLSDAEYRRRMAAAIASALAP